MAGPRDRSRHRGMESYNQYELQDLQTPHRSLTGEGSTAHSEDAYDDRNHGHPQDSGAQGLNLIMLRTCKERSAALLGTCKARSAEVLWMCMQWPSKHRMMTLFMASIICILVLLASKRLNPSIEPPTYWFNRSTGRAGGHDQSAITVTHSYGPTVYRMISVHYKQFYVARLMHHQELVAVRSNLRPQGQVKRQDLSHPYVGTRTSTSVPGLYLMPMSSTNGDWLQTQQDTHPSSRPMSNTQGSQSRQGSPSLGDSKSETKGLLRSREVGPPRWRGKALYGFRRPGHPSLQFYKGWCIENACSPHKQLSSMCNTTKTISDSFREQECKWCWPEDRRKHQEIANHCTEVSKRAFNAVFVICGIFLFCTLVIAILLATRLLQRRRRARADRLLHAVATTAFPIQEKIAGVPSHRFLHGISKFGRPFSATNYRVDQEIATGGSDPCQRVPVLPPAPPAISSRVFHEIENMGQGSLLWGAGTNSSQRTTQGMPHRSSTQLRAVSSGSEQTPSEAKYWRDSGANFHNLHRLTERS